MKLDKKYLGDFAKPHADIVCGKNHVLVPRCRYTIFRIRRWVMQCTKCGLWSYPIPKTHPEVVNMADYIDTDDALRVRTQMLISEQYEAAKLRKRQEWRQRYTAYLSSPNWAKKRKHILYRDGYACQAQFPGCTYNADQVHHLSYANMGNEPDEDLISVCFNCHSAIHPQMVQK